MMLVSKLGIFLILFAFLQKAQSFDNETLKNFSDFYAYRKALGKSESADEIARLFVKDSVQGEILKDKKVGLKDFLSMLDAYSKSHAGVVFHSQLEESEYSRLLEEQQAQSLKVRPTSTMPNREALEPKGCLSGQKHSFYGNYRLDENHQTDFLKEFDPNKLPKLVSQDAQVFADILKPTDHSIPYNAEQVIEGKDFKIDSGYYGALNMNADLGLQHTIEKILFPEVLVQKDIQGREKPTFVLVSSGHAIAGLASLAKLTQENSEGKRICLFDTSIYMPKGTWKSSTRMNVATQGAAIWGQSIANAKKKCSSYAGGVAVALNGHRGDFDLQNFDTRAANIDAKKVFGTPDEFVQNLKRKGIGRVVVITETVVDDPSKVNRLPLEILKEGDSPTFNYANRDLYDFLKEIRGKGIEVVVVSGEQRVNRCKGSTPLQQNLVPEPVRPVR